MSAVAPEFRARLRPPMRTLWLGCEVLEVNTKISQVSGRGYLSIRFANCPFFAIWHHMSQKWFRQLMEEHGIVWPIDEVPIRPGDKLNLDVRWEIAPELPGDRLYPRPDIDISSVVRLRV